MLLKFWYYLCLKNCKKLFIKKDILQNIKRSINIISYYCTNAFDQIPIM